MVESKIHSVLTLKIKLIQLFGESECEWWNLKIQLVVKFYPNVHCILTSCSKHQHLQINYINIGYSNIVTFICFINGYWNFVLSEKIRKKSECVWLWFSIKWWYFFFFFFFIWVVELELEEVGGKGKGNAKRPKASWKG